MNFYELYLKLNEFYPEQLRCQWDNDGIMCSADLDKEVKKVLISLDVTSDVVKYAVDNGFDTIISHHPLVFKSQKSLSPLIYTQKKLIELIKNNVGVMSFHTRLDAASGGVNDVLCGLLQLKGVSVDASDPIGRIGYVDEQSLTEFSKKVKLSLSAPFVLYSGDRIVHKVYVVGGDGKDLVENALHNGCDTIITGRASYNVSIDACDMGINIVEAGHFYTEHPVCAELKRRIESLLTGVEAEIYYSNKINFI